MWIKKSENLIKHTSVMIVMCSLKPHDLQFKTIQIVQERLALLWRENGKVFSPSRSACKSVSIMCLRCERSEETSMKVFFSNQTKAFLYSHRYQVLPINKRLLCYNQLWKYLLRWTLPSGVCGGTFVLQCHTKRALKAFWLENWAQEKIPRRQAESANSKSLDRKKNTVT